MLDKLIGLLLGKLKLIDIIILIIVGSLYGVIYNVPIEVFGWYPNVGIAQKILRGFPIILLATVWFVWQYLIPFISERWEDKLKDLVKRENRLGWILGIVIGICFIVWFCVFYFVEIRIHDFEANELCGIFVAQIQGEQNDNKQIKIVKSLNKKIEELAYEKGGAFGSSRAKKLNKTITCGEYDRESIFKANERARLLGKKGRAQIVIWGSSDNLQMTIVNNLSGDGKCSLILIGETTIKITDERDKGVLKDEIIKPLLWFIGGYSYLLKGHPDGALAHFQNANTTNETLLDNSNFYIGLSRLIMCLKNPQPELNLLNEAAAAFELTKECFYKKKRQADEKIECIDTTSIWSKKDKEDKRRIQSSLSKTLGNLGVIYQKISKATPDKSKAQNLLNKAIEYYKEGLRLHCQGIDKALIQVNLGTAQLNSGETEKAIDSFERAKRVFEKEPKFQLYTATVLTNLGIVYQAYDGGEGIKRNLVKAIKYLKRAGNLFTTKNPQEYQWSQGHLVKAYIQLGLLVMNEGKHGEACAYFKSALKILPKNSDYYSEISSLLQQLEGEQ